MDDIAVKIENVSKSFEIHHEGSSSLREVFVNLFKEKKKPTIYHALSDISFDIKKGDFIGIIGKNGSGKSTLLKIIAGIYQPNNGKVSVNGKIIPFLELGVGFNPMLSARENVFLNGIILGMTRKEVEKKYEEIIDFAEVKEFEDMPLKTFSSGMQVRLAFSIATQAKGDIYIMDEVLAVGDANFQEKCLMKLNQLIKERKTIIFVSHDISSIRRFCNKVAYISDSKLKYLGDTFKGTNRYYNDLFDIKEEKKDRIRNSKEETVKTKWRIDTVTVLDKKNNKRKTFRTGETLKIRIKTNSSSLIDKPLIGIALYRNDGIHINGANTKVSELKLDSINGNFEITYKINDLPLVGGEYRITVGLFEYDESVTYDYKDSIESFLVLHDIKNPNGIVAMNDEWIIA